MVSSLECVSIINNCSLIPRLTVVILETPLYNFIGPLVSPDPSTLERVWSKHEILRMEIVKVWECDWRWFGNEWS